MSIKFTPLLSPVSETSSH